MSRAYFHTRMRVSTSAITARRKGLAGAGQQDRTHARIGIDDPPDLGQFGVHPAIGSVELVRPIHDHAKHSRMRPIDQQPRKARIVFSHLSFSNRRGSLGSRRRRRGTSRTNKWRWALPVEAGWGTTPQEQSLASDLAAGAPRSAQLSWRALFQHLNMIYSASGCGCDVPRPTARVD